jgi:hypothetical protein
MERPVGGIETLRLPELTVATPRKPDTNLLPVYSVAGPDSLGRIAFVENDMTNERHALKIIAPDGKSETIFEAAGDALWGHAVGEHLALDTRGINIALVVRAKGMEDGNPDALLMEGELEVWRVAEHKRALPPTPAYDDVLSWFPDGKRLLYTAFMNSDEAEKLLRTHVGPEDPFGRKIHTWKRVPVVHVLNIETGKSRVLVRDFELNWRVLDLETNKSKPFKASGAIFPGAIAFIDAQTVLYWAWPTEGDEIKYTKNYGLPGPKQMKTLKLVDLRDGRFQTVSPCADSRNAISFGADPALAK